MLTIKVTLGQEYFDYETEEFVEAESCVLQLEHSLVSISEWESKWNKPFLSNTAMTDEETLDYIRCMTLTENIDPSVYEHLSTENVNQIQKYIEAPMTATTFSQDKSGKGGREIVTAELIYYWMIALTIPFECQYWHLNRLLTLIRVCNIKNQPPKKMSKREIMSRNAALNAQRRAQLNSKG